MKIIIADDQPSVRSALKLVLTERDNRNVIFEADSLEELLNQARVCCPDLVILDWELMDSASVRPVNSLKKLCSKAKVLALTSAPQIMHDRREFHDLVVISKIDPPEKLRQALNLYFKKT